MKIAVVIVNFNSHSDLILTVESLEASNLPKEGERRVIVVENGSRDGEREWGELQKLKKYPDTHLIRSDKNLGFTGGNNLGIDWAKKWGADYFLLLNPDTKVKEDFLVKLLESFKESGVGGVGLASPKIYFYPGFEFHKERYKESDLGKVIWYGGGKIDWDNIVGLHENVDEVDRGQFSNEAMETEFATGCAMFVSREVISKIGGLDDKYFLNWEDVDYSMRAKRAGFKVVYVPEAVVWHKNAVTKGGSGSKLEDYYQTRNRLIFAFKYSELKIKLLLLLTLLEKGDGNRIRAVLSAMASLIVL